MSHIGSFAIGLFTGIAFLFLSSAASYQNGRDTGYQEGYCYATGADSTLNEYCVVDQKLVNVDWNGAPYHG